MSSPTRTKAPVRGAKGKSKSGRRPPVNVRVRSGRDLMLLPIAVGGILIAVAIAVIVAIVVNRPNTATAAGRTVAGISCDAQSRAQVHYHAALQIVYHGTLTPIPSGIGIVGGEATPTCFYWLHVHGANKDVIHIESPAGHTFTLGDFFAIWASWAGKSEPLDAKHVSSFTLAPDDNLVIYVVAGDGKTAQLYTGDPKKIALSAHEVITLEITSPASPPTTPPAFTFTQGL